MTGLTCTVQCQGTQLSTVPHSQCGHLCQVNIITQTAVLFSFYRARFESLCFSLFQQSLSVIDRVLATSNVTKDKVDQVISVPGKQSGITKALIILHRPMIMLQETPDPMLLTLFDFIKEHEHILAHN